MKRMFTLVLTTAVLHSAAQVALAQHDHEHEDMIVGQSGGGQLMIEFGHFDEEHLLAPVSGLFNGWCGDAPGFGHLEADEPGEDLYTLPDGVEVAFEVVSIDSGLVIDPLTSPLDGPGDSTVLGGDHLHTHVEFCLYDWATPESQAYSVTFRLTDTGTIGLSPSPNYTLSFVPEPATLGVLSFGLLALLRRR